MNNTTYRVPEIIQNLQTQPQGGHWKLKRFKPQIKALWTLIVHHADPQSYDYAFKLAEMAEIMNIHKNTVRNHLSWMAKHNLISFSNRHGGRGQGLQIKVLWLEKGADLAARRQRAEQYQLEKRQKREQNLQNYKRVQQDKHRLLHPTGDLKNRAMKTIRTILKDQIKHPLFARHATNAFGVWIKRCQPTAEVLTVFIERLRTMKHLPVPRWCKKVPDVYRWIRGLIYNFTVYPDWQQRFEARAEVKRFNKALKAMQKATTNNQPCPICKGIHTQDDFDFGEDETRQRNCAGWLREQRADALKLWHSPPPLIPRQPQKT